MKTVAFYTLGCKLNFAETSAMRREFNQGSYKIIPFDQTADIYIINTCSVTSDANSDCRKFVRRALRQNPEAYIAVTGCYAQLEPHVIGSIKGVNLVVGTKEKFDLPKLVKSLDKSEESVIYRSDVNEAVDFHHAISSDDRTRAFLKIQDGCDYKCSFCTIPMARGSSRSPEIKEVIKQAQIAVTKGFREIILTGVNAGDFGSKNNQSLLELLKALDQLTDIARIRISSIEPNLLTDDIIHFAADSGKIQPHFHIPLQSGSNKMLYFMRRRYNSDLYRQKVELIRKHIPHAAIGVDVIAGHPGESDELFKESIDFIKSIDVSYLHVFTYSERPDTHALSISPVVPFDIRKKRTHQLRRHSLQKRWDFEHRFSGSSRPVLFEETQKNEHMYGWTDNYIRVRIPATPKLVNQILDVKLQKHHLNGFFDGKLIKSTSALTSNPGNRAFTNPSRFSHA